MASNDKYSEIYNKAYRFVTPDFLSPDNIQSLNLYLKQNNESIMQYLRQYFDDRGGLASLANLEILEAGCGLGGLSLELSKHGANTLGIDISELAISGAREIAALNSSHAEFITKDLTANLVLERKFDFIIDSHLLHCLTSNEKRENYFKFIKEHLKEDGVFIVETAVFDDEIREPLGYDIDQEFVLSQEVEGEMLPIRKLSTVRSLEEEIKSGGFAIHTFFYHYELSFNVFPDIENYPAFRLPKTVRYSAKLPKE